MITTDKLRSFYFLRECTEMELDTITKYITTQYFRKNDIVYYANNKSEYIYIIEDGFVGLSFYDEENDKDIHITTLIKGDIFGIGEIFFENYYLSAKALSNCTLMKIKSCDFHKIIENNPSINKFVIKTFADIIKQNFIKMTFSSSKSQFELFFVYLAKEFGRVLDDTIVIPINFSLITHEKISLILNLSREQVTRLFSQYQKDGIIEKRESFISINRKWYNERIEKLSDTSFRRFYHIGISSDTEKIFSG